MDALIDLGRPKAIKLAVLVERAGREFPIQADFVGYRAKVTPDQSVQVSLVESDGKDEVLINQPQEPERKKSKIKTRKK
jgi:pyrimidine operon attenuation protein/uracil phosphoribosyltransferase